MKKLLSIALLCVATSVAFAQCALDMTITVDGNGNIQTTNNSIGADPASYIWYVYNLDMNPWVAEYLESANTITYAPMFVGNYLVCLVATEFGTNNACDSLCEPLQYTQSMMNLQSTNGLELTTPNNSTLYPIPAKEHVHVSDYNASELEFIEAIDMSGIKKKLNYHILNGELDIDISVLEKGVYFLLIRSETEEFKYKLLVDR